MNSSSRHRVAVPRGIHRRTSRAPATTLLANWKLRNGSKKVGSSSVVSARKLLPPDEASDSSEGNNSCGEYGHFKYSKSLSPHPKSSVGHVTFPTGWCNGGDSKASTKAYNYFLMSRMNLLEDRVKSVSNTSTLQEVQLLHAQLQTDKLTTDLRSSRSQLTYLSRKLEEEKMLWQRREHERNCEVIGSLKEELRRERESKHRLEIVNSELAKEIAGVKSSAKQLMQDYEEQKKVEKAEIEALRREAEMSKMAEAWREERLHMKLMDARLALEHKFSQMNMLISALENVDDTELVRKACVIREAARSVRIQDVDEEFDYSSPIDGDLYSIVEEVRKAEGHLDQAVRGGAFTCDASQKQESTDDKLEAAGAVDVFRVESVPEKGGETVRSREVEAVSRRRKSMEGEDDPKAQGSIVRRNSLELVSNPHVVQGMKGHVEWPKGLARRNTKMRQIVKHWIKRQNNSNCLASTVGLFC